MTPKNEEFARQWLIDKNKTQAAIRAGYSKKTAAQSGERMFRNVEVKAYIDKLLEKQAKRTEITADKVLHEIADIAFDKEEKKYHRIKCLELLGKNQKLFTDKVELGPSDTDKKWKIEIVDSDKD